MKTLYLDLSMGAAGDMLTAALLELCPDREGMLQKLNGLGIPGVRFQPEQGQKLGVPGTHMAVTVHGEEEEEGHHHAHNAMVDIKNIIQGMNASRWVKDKALAVYRRIAKAESQVHEEPVNLIHFHEVGALDAVADVAAVCTLLEALAPEKILASPIHVGFGTLWCAHGRLPVPAPATALLLGATNNPLHSFWSVLLVYSGQMALRYSSAPPTSSSAGSSTVLCWVFVTVRVTLRASAFRSL